MCVPFPRLSLVLSPNLKTGIFIWENTMIGWWVSWHKIDWLNQRKKSLCVANAFCIQCSVTWYHWLITFCNSLCNREFLQFIIRHYGHALEYGCKYLYQCMPRLLTLWLDFGCQVPDSGKPLNCVYTIYKPSSKWAFSSICALDHYLPTKCLNEHVFLIFVWFCLA